MTNPMDLKGRRVLVTGASSGIGRATAVLLSELGAQVILVGRSAQNLHTTLSLMNGTGHAVEVFDLADLDVITPWLTSLSTKLGPLSGLVHCAAVQATKPLRYLTIADQNSTMQVNYLSALSLTKAFRQRTVHSRPASVVLVSSVMGLVGQRGQTAYAATKGALISATRAMALELAEDAIRINCVAPGVVDDTEMTRRARCLLTPEQVDIMKAQHPLGTGTSKDVGHAIAFLVADTGRWITGSTLVVDGGYTAQ